METGDSCNEVAFQIVAGTSRNVKSFHHQSVKADMKIKLAQSVSNISSKSAIILQLKLCQHKHISIQHIHTYF